MYPINFKKLFRLAFVNLIMSVLRRLFMSNVKAKQQDISERITHFKEALDYYGLTWEAFAEMNGSSLKTVFSNLLNETTRGEAKVFIDTFLFLYELDRDHKAAFSPKSSLYNLSQITLTGIVDLEALYVRLLYFELLQEFNNWKDEVMQRQKCFCIMRTLRRILHIRELRDGNTGAVFNDYFSKKDVYALAEVITNIVESYKLNRRAA